MITKNYNSFAALICATDTEEEAIKQIFGWEEIIFPGDNQRYYEAILYRDGTPLRIVGARQNEMGMVAAATLTMKLIEHFRPVYLIMPGIMAGGSNDNGAEFFGDIIIAERIWDYANGKYVSPESSDVQFGSLGFISRPISITLPEQLVSMLRKIEKEDNNEFTLHLGTIACGNCVVANSEAFEKLVKSPESETLGLDMESYGVAYAAANCTVPRPFPIIAKSICDFADESKNDRFQMFAAFNSCQFVKHLLTNILPINPVP